ncbi:hypothetical protein MINTMi27_32260 [Mycobacterium intracellulare]|uniref:hypothetical protein n=1 Tax=Mycobacterium intracellulare TaxID=1767 RepID=UPI00193881F2|nr:hypothetical protein [Mycobacterium intracellulare]BCP43133.1 hypothetical protein MINTMi27_32260 [Mycobacterium intracellulare]
MGSGPRLYRPRSELADHIEFFGHWLHRGATYRSRALPRGAVTIVFDVGHRQQLDLYAADGTMSLARVMGPPFCHEHGTGCFRLLAVW